MNHTVDKIYYSINKAAELTGLSSFYLRSGCKDGSVPHIKSGEKYLVNLPRLLEKLAQTESATADSLCGQNGKEDEAE